MENLKNQSANGLISIVDGRAMTTSLKIAEKFGKEHKDVLRKIREKMNLFTERNFTLSEFIDTTGRKLPMYELDRDFTTFLIMGFTGKQADKWKLDYINAFNTMEDMLKTGGVNNISVAKGEIELFETTARILNLNDNSKLLCVHNIYENNGLRHDYLPQYTESKDQLLSATELLKRNNINISAVKFNKIMLESGLLEERERPSSKGGTKKFKALKDLTYGENQVSPKNPKETQALYYASKFNELCNRLGI